MPEITAKLKLRRYYGNESVHRDNYNANIDLLEANAASQEEMNQPFYLKEASYNEIQNRIECTFGSGKASFLGTLVAKTEDSTYYINSPVSATTYYIFLKSDGTYTHNTTGAGVMEAVLIWQIATGVTVDLLTSTDNRGRLPGAAARVVQDNLNTHATAATLDHPDGSVIDLKLGNRTITDTLSPTVDEAAVTTLLSNIGYMIKLITGESNWRTDPVIDLETLFAKFTGLTGHGHTEVDGDGPKITSAGLAAGAADDTAIGNRTVADTIAPTGNTAVLTTLLSNLCYMIKRITGKDDWMTSPAFSLETLYETFYTRHLGANGYQKFWGGMLIQWGTYSSTSSGLQIFNFPTVFPNTCYVVLISRKVDESYYPIFPYGWDAMQFSVDRYNGIGSSTVFSIIAIGH